MLTIKHRWRDDPCWSGEATDIKEAIAKARSRRADLQDADLQDADLQDADLRRADLQDADLQGAKNAELAIAMTRILPEGAIFGWKKCRDNVIVKLEIPAEVGRSLFDERFVYRVGETVRPDSWSEHWCEECDPGIHFYITRIEAENHA